ncbi:MAG TPA: peptidase P60 [Gallionellaceae bacterium]|nr:peptidase P60 [Gallionellaceae bacterium]
MSESLKAAILAHAQAESPRECCGVIVNVGRDRGYVACRNLADDPRQHFQIHHEDFARAEDQGEIIAIVHSHPFANVQPSEADKVACEDSGLPWVIVNPQTEAFGIFEPSGYEAQLIGRQFVYGVLDCYTLVLDYYRRELGIMLPYYVRDDSWGWWERGQNLYADRFAEAGFVAVHTPQPGDVILMQVQSDVANHAAVYLGDNVILHHLVKQLSRRDMYGGYWQKHTLHILRHRSRC